MKTLRCRDAGFNCDYKIEGKDEGEIIRKAREHGQKAHNVQSLTPDQEKSLRGQIKNL